MNVGLWVLQIAAAGMFLMVRFLKLSGDAQLVGLFKAIGLGQWFRDTYKGLLPERKPGKVESRQETMEQTAG